MDASSQLWHALDQSQVEEGLRSGPGGLSQVEALSRLDRFGPNEVEIDPGPSNVTIAVRQFRSPLVIALLIAAGITVVVGELADAVAIMLVVLANAVIGFVQERQAERSVRSLLELIHPRARVVRQHEECEIESRAVVPGDLTIIEAGGRVPADIRLVAATELLVDESALTGEAEPARKQTEPLDPALALADRANMAYAGTVVSSGEGRGYVVATGRQTEIGEIAEVVRSVDRSPTPMQAQLDQLVRIIGVAVGVLALATFLAGLATGQPASEMFLVAVTLAVSAIPEGLPIAFTIALAVSVRRMAQRRAIVRRLAAVETLGGATIIGSDKTGTLTENRMTVRAIWSAREIVELEGAVRAAESPPSAPAPTFALERHPHHWTALVSVATNAARFGGANSDRQIIGDPTEVALLDAALRLGIDPESAQRAFPIRADRPFDAERQYSATVRDFDGRQMLFVKGAPERIVGMCSQMLLRDGELAPCDRQSIDRAIGQMAASGLRVLAMAYRTLPAGSIDRNAVAPPSDLVFAGLQGLADPPRPGVRDAIATCKQAGIRILMITGDHATTAQAIAQELGIAAADTPVVTGQELETLGDDALDRATARASIFARVEPAHKLRIVRSLQRQGEVVAVTGDGVNDAPALRAADVGIAMGKRGTDVAKEAADIVLTDDDFVSIAAAVHEGRIATANVRRIVFFLFSTNVAEVATVLIALLIDWPLPLLAVQILWLNLVTDSLPVMALAFEPGEPDAMTQPPRGRHEPILSRLLWQRLALSSLVMTVGALALFHHELMVTGSEASARTVTLTALVFFQMAQAVNAASFSESILRRNPLRNRKLLLAIAGALAIQGVAVYAGPVQQLLDLEPLRLSAWLLIVGATAALVLVVECEKLLRRRLG